MLVGSISSNYDARSVVERAGLAEVVTITGYVSRADFEDYVAAADVCLNLRHPTAGETSASLLRLLGAGRPTLVTASGSFTELPPGVAAQVDPDASEDDLILAYCRLLAERPDIATAMGATAREYVARNHTLDGAALGYMQFLAQLYGWGEVQPLRDTPLWDVEATARQGGRETRGQGDKETARQENSETSEVIVAPHMIQPVADALVELGMTEDDHGVLEAAAQALRELH
jgi:hypothetical protein